jgi:FixJ family two-component response regulator
MSRRNSVVAVIDNDSGILRAMKRLFSAYEYETELYASATEFLEVAAASMASCLIVDVKLEDISGVELALQLKEGGFTFPIIFMSASDDGVIERRAIEAGCIAYLRKPFSAELLMGALDKVTR